MQQTFILFIYLFSESCIGISIQWSIKKISIVFTQTYLAVLA